MTLDERTLKPKGWIANYVDVICEDLKAIEPQWALANAESVFSGCSFRQFSYTNAGTLYLGLWNMGIAPSGEWKSIVILSFSVPIMDYVKEHYNKQHQLVISRFTPESLIKYMMWHEKKEYNPKKEVQKKNPKTGKLETKYGGYEKYMVVGNRGIIIKDEWTSMMKGMVSKNWLAGTSEILSEVFDHRILPRYTIQHGSQEVPFCNFAFLSSTTPYIYEVMQKSFFTQGLGNRIDWNVFGEKNKVKKREEEDYEHGHHEIREEDIKTLGNQLLGVINSNVSYVGFSPEALKLHIKYDLENQKEKAKLTPTDLRRSYTQRQSPKCLRRSVIYAMSRMINAIPKVRDIIVLEEDMQCAINRQKQLYQNFLKLLDNWRSYSPSDERPARVDISDKTRVLITMRRLKLASRALLAEITGYNKDSPIFIRTYKSLVAEGKLKLIDREQAKMLIAKMSDEERVRQKVNPKPRGNPPSFFKYVEKKT